jgi:adenylate cyclase
MDNELAVARSQLVELGVDPEVVARASVAECARLRLRQTLWGSAPDLTAAEIGARVGLPGDTVRRLWTRLGFPDPVDRAEFRDVDVPIFGLGAAGIEFFDLDGIDKFSLVVGMSVRRIAEAASSLLGDELEHRDGLDAAEQLEQTMVATQLLRAVAEEILPVVLLHAMQETLEFATLVESEGGGHQCVAFCDLAGSTALLNSSDDPSVMDELAAFEVTAHELVVHHRGQVVKFVGDEVMYTTAAPADAISVGRALLRWVAERPAFGEARVGIAVGPVLQRDGDVFGPTVNRAARLAGSAEAGTLVVDAALSADGREAGLSLRGFSELVPVRVLTPET